MGLCALAYMRRFKGYRRRFVGLPILGYGETSKTREKPLKTIDGENPEILPDKLPENLPGLLAVASGIRSG